jgi:hypothetical protein
VEVGESDPTPDPEVSDAVGPDRLRVTVTADVPIWMLRQHETADDAAQAAVKLYDVLDNSMEVLQRHFGIWGRYSG